MLSIDILRRSLRRSYVRMRIAVILVQRGTLHAEELADLAGIEQRTLYAAMYGDDPKRRTYRADLSLVNLGIVQEIRARRELKFRATSVGARVVAHVMRERRGRGWH